MWHGANDDGDGNGDPKAGEETVVMKRIDGLYVAIEKLTREISELRETVQQLVAQRASSAPRLRPGPRHFFPRCSSGTPPQLVVEPADITGRQHREWWPQPAAVAAVQQP
jgi:hypothetical protein